MQQMLNSWWFIWWKFDVGRKFIPAKISDEKVVIPTYRKHVGGQRRVSSTLSRCGWLYTFLEMHGGTPAISIWCQSRSIWRISLGCQIDRYWMPQKILWRHHTYFLPRVLKETDNCRLRTAITDALRETCFSWIAWKPPLYAFGMGKLFSSVEESIHTRRSRSPYNNSWSFGLSRFIDMPCIFLCCRIK